MQLDINGRKVHINGDFEDLTQKEYQELKDELTDYFKKREVRIRRQLIEEDQKFKSFPPPDYSKMTNEQIRFRTKLLKSTFELAFKKRNENT